MPALKVAWHLVGTTYSEGHGLALRPGGGGARAHLELVRLPRPDQLGDEEVGVEKVHVLVQEAVEDEQAVGPGDKGGARLRPGACGLGGRTSGSATPTPGEGGGRTGGSRKVGKGAPAPGTLEAQNVLELRCPPGAAHQVTGHLWLLSMWKVAGMAKN